ncbi:hypothetical protein NSQ38_22555 [Paenibacillus sp. FSL R7-0313]|uniref:hypothetical protein n=1 Tax=Paenibacillus sp. FSL R7-0313 TaxID=2954532 RepID=UPI0030DD5993
MTKNKNASKKKSLLDVVGSLGPIHGGIQEQTKGKTFDQIRKEAITKHFQEQYEMLNSSNEKNNETQKTLIAQC